VDTLILKPGHFTFPYPSLSQVSTLLALGSLPKATAGAVSFIGTDRPSALPPQLCQESEGHRTRRKVLRIRLRRPNLTQSGPRLRALVAAQRILLASCDNTET
jgi:hypothetical protein